MMAAAHKVITKKIEITAAIINLVTTDTLVTGTLSEDDPTIAPLNIGCPDGSADGLTDGSNVGSAVGFNDGTFVGVTEGSTVGVNDTEG